VTKRLIGYSLIESIKASAKTLSQGNPDRNPVDKAVAGILTFVRKSGNFVDGEMFGATHSSFH